MRYEKSRQAKAKYDGFFINQGAVELERDPEAEEEQRQGQKRGPRQRPQPGAQPSKAKSQQPVQANRTGGAAISAAATTAGTGIAAAAVNGGAQTPGRVSGKRRVEGDQQQPASKKRKQPQPDAGPAGQKSPRRGVSVAPSGATLPGAPQGLAAFAASLGRSAGATAATSGAAAAAVAAAPAWPVASAERATGQQPAEATSEPAGAVSGSLLPRAVSRRHGANTASLDSVINECIKKLTAASMPPSDWASLVKLLDAPLTQVALFLHRKHQGDSHGYDTGLALVVKALAEAAPAVVVDTKLVHEIFQRRVTRSTNELARIAATVHKLVGEVAAAEAAAPQLGNGGGAAGGHSSDDEFTESAGAAASSVLLEALDAKLRSYLNLYRKLHNSEDDGAILQSLAVQASVGIDVFQRVLLSAQNRSTAQRKRQGTKAGTVGVDEALRQQAAIIAAEVQGQVQGQSMATATVIRNGQVAGLGSNVTAAAVTVPVAQRGQSPAAVLGSVAPEPAEAVTEAVPGAYGSQPEGHQFPTAEDDQQQRRLCRVAFKSCPTAKEELLNRAFEAAASSEWAALTIKVLCHCPEGMSISELAKRAVELRYIVWPTTRPISDMHRQLRQAIGRVSIAPHVIHVGNSKYLLQAMRPDAKAVPRQAPAGRTGGGGSANSSPAAAVPPAAVMHTIGGGGAFSGMAGPPVPFSLLGALPVESAGTGSGGGLQQQNPTGAAQLSGAGPDSGAGADAAGGGGSTATGGGGEEELTLEEDSQQCRECLEAAVRAGADRQRVQEALSRLKSRNLRIVFKVLCHAGPTGLRVTDIVKFAREHRFVNWPDAADRTRSVHCAIRTSKDMIVHVGTHQYALTLFPGVVHVPK
ncbi:hypothetical protein Vretimale_530 [Volvox reticuliferus]|nr:hypothetical protein Vretimale_530 [Volvox reticuliferus]